MKKLIAAAVLSGLMFSALPPTTVADVEGPREELRPPVVAQTNDPEGPREELRPPVVAQTNDPEGPREELRPPVAS
ncbi:MAG: hypothetical protein QN187_06065 [Armatimonadota bacterium]|nr:hypothetical protein [Armatimonadota bacterium]MDR7520345.1 hypothetical protein [Armatimonadota bacterium]